ncbi:putative immunity protein [Microbacterium sp. Mu-80]|uniref:Immunity protein n=1 Tax=Microbacterium bandirmense TaxID=3122050 RepID=A0ABU8LAT6_9MICO
MASAQSLSLADRRIVAAWASDCAERVLPLFEQEAPRDGRPRDAVARTRAFSRGEIDAAGEIRRRFVAGRAAAAVTAPAAVAAARAAAQAAGVAHMGAHALAAVRLALRQLPALGSDSAGPLGAGLLAVGDLGEAIRRLQAAL